MMAKQYAKFITVKGLNWKPVLSSIEHKEIILNSLRFLVKEGRVRVSCFVLMDNHFLSQRSLREKWMSERRDSA
jgi:putative transposase